jgi:hypothetical protein
VPRVVGVREDPAEELDDLQPLARSLDLQRACVRARARACVRA